uniref:Uncharacterized protein n=2 Tax=Zooxanthella nutricula TaxID=1333877 RepID=A0A7S2MBP1_9DINO
MQDEHQGQQKGVVALLQEFVQCTRHFPLPQHRPILQWAYDQRMVNATALEFRGTVAFLLDGLPHHICGGWHPSKKLAQRDAASRALAFFVGRWGEHLLESNGQPVQAPAVAKGAPNVRVLDAFCADFAACRDGAPDWTCAPASDGFVAQCRLTLLGVPHKFAGAARPTEEAAREDAARRVLWYFQCPGYEGIYAPDPRAPAVLAKEIPAPPPNWACDRAEVAELQKAERKTVLMRVQNRLQQEFAKQLKPGESVWEWDYEMDESDTAWPPLCRAKALVPSIGRTFVGDWARGQRDAQIEASCAIAEFLDGGGCETREPSSGSEWASEEGADQIESWSSAERWADMEIDVC